MTKIAKYTLFHLSLGILITLTINACRPPSGPNDYASQEYIPDAAMPLTLDLAEGEERLSFGIFYEGPFTEEVVIDDITSHFYIYEETFSMITLDTDRVEGLNSDLITHRGGAWWGGGVHWDEARNLSTWQTLHLSLKSEKNSFTSLQIAMNNSDTSQAKLDLSAYGFKADGAWYNLEIPLSDFADLGLNLSQVRAPLVFIGQAGMPGDRLLIDAVYLSQY